MLNWIYIKLLKAKERRVCVCLCLFCKSIKSSSVWRIFGQVLNAAQLSLNNEWEEYSNELSSKQLIECYHTKLEIRNTVI